jgi:crooked neck
MEFSVTDLAHTVSHAQRVVLLEAWKAFEQEHGDEESLAKVQELMPKVMKKWRQAEDGSGLEECRSMLLDRRKMWLTSISLLDYDMVFADDEREANPASFKFFQAAQEWKQRAAAMAEDLSDSSSSDDDEDDEDREEE